MSDQQIIIVSIDGFSEQCEINTKNERVINLASSLEKSVIFIVRRFMDSEYAHASVDQNTNHGFSMLEQEICLISRHITPKLLSFSELVLADDEYEDADILFMTNDRSGAFKWINVNLSVTTKPAAEDEIEDHEATI